MIERQYNATYIGDFCLKSPDGQWSENEYPVFWQEVTKDPSHSNYMTVFRRGSEVRIAGAASVTEGHWDGAVANDGEIVYSRSRHDYRTSTDGSVSVDGGRDYFKRMGGLRNPTVKITVVRENLVVNDCLILPTKKPVVAA